MDCRLICLAFAAFLALLPGCGKSANVGEIPGGTVLGRPTGAAEGPPYAIPFSDVAAPLPDNVSYYYGTNDDLAHHGGNAGNYVLRNGFYSPGDGGAAYYYWSGVNCTKPDNGAQIQPVGITGCWIADFSGMNPTPMIWGCKGEGTINDTACFQAAVDARAGESLYIGPYKYCIGAPGIQVFHPVRIQGETKNNDVDSNKYGLYACATDIIMIEFYNDGSRSSSGSRLSDVYFNARAAGANATGAAVAAYAVDDVTVENLRIDGACIGIDDQLTTSFKIRHVQIENKAAGNPHLAAGCGGIRVGVNSTSSQTVDTRIEGSTISVVADWSLLVLDAGGLFLDRNDFLLADNGTILRPGVNQQVLWLFASSTALGDNTCFSGLLIDTTDASAHVDGASFVQTWTASAGRTTTSPSTSCQGNGVSIWNSGGGTVNGLHFTGHRSFSNAGHGMLINSGVKNVSIDASQICNNSLGTASLPGTIYGGIYLAANAADVAIRDNHIGRSCMNIGTSSGYQGSGIYMAGTNGNLLIVGNDLRDNAVQPIGAAGELVANNVIKANLGADDTFTNVPAASTLILALTGTQVITGGPATVDNMTQMFGGREAFLWARDSTITFNGGPGLPICNAKTMVQYAVLRAYKAPGLTCIYLFQ